MGYFDTDGCSSQIQLAKPVDFESISRFDIWVSPENSTRRGIANMTIIISDVNEAPHLPDQSVELVEPVNIEDDSSCQLQYGELSANSICSGNSGVLLFMASLTLFKINPSQLCTDDPDVGDTFQFSISLGDPDGMFEVSRDGVLRLTRAGRETVDFESVPYYTIRVVRSNVAFSNQQARLCCSWTGFVSLKINLAQCYRTDCP